MFYNNQMLMMTKLSNWLSRL